MAREIGRFDAAHRLHGQANMKTFLALFLVFALCSIAHADEDGTTKGLLANGIVASTLGTIAVVAGGALYGSAQTAWNRPNGCYGSCTDGAIVNEGAGIGLLAAGAAHLAVGIPLLATGAYRARHRRVEVYGAAAPNAKGVAGTVGIRF
jgi:hypothetical protein